MTTYEWIGLVATGGGLVLGYLMGRHDGRQLGVTQETLRELKELDLNPETAEAVASYMRTRERWGSIWPDLERAEAAVEASTELVRKTEGVGLENFPRWSSPKIYSGRLADQMAQCRKGDDRDVYPDW